MTLALTLILSPGRGNNHCAFSVLRITIRPIQSQIFARDGGRFSLSLGRGPG